MRNAALLLAVSLTAALCAQETPVIKMTTRQVQVSVVVHDKKGQLVSDLTKDDFVLYDKGQEQKIGYFAKEAAKPAAIEGRLGPGVASNRQAGAGGTAAATSLTVILIDGLNTKFGDRASAEQALVQFLGEVRPGDPVVVYALTDTLKLLRTGNPQAMSEHLKEFLVQAMTVTTYDQRQRVLQTLAALQTIASNLAGIPGRKNLIWLTDGFPVLSGLTPSGRMGRNFESFEEDVRRTVQVLDAVSVAIYPVDARGMVSTFDMSPSTAPSTQTPRSRRAATRMDAAAKNDIQQSEGTMVDVAERTGGRAYMGSNDIGEFIRDAVSDTRVTYTIAYSPSHDQWDGRFREIKVKVKRSGVEVRCRKGYFAFPQADDASVRATALASAIDSPLDSTGLGLMAKLAPGGLQFVVDVHDVAFHQDPQGLWIADLDTTLLMRDAQGATVNRMNTPVHASLKQEEYDQILKNGLISLKSTMDTPASAVRLRLVVRDLSTGMIGSVDLPILVIKSGG